MNKSRMITAIATAAVAVAALAAPLRAAEIEPEADRILREMSDHLAGLQSFAIETEVASEVLLFSGEKVQLLAAGGGVFDRARGFRFKRMGADGAVEAVFDGTTMTLSVPEEKAYHALSVAGGNDAALDEVRSVLGVEAAGGVDLLYSNPYEGLNFEVESGRYLGEINLGGVKVHHLAYRAAHVDWQLWISAEGDPLPLRYVITSKWMTGAPQFTVQVRAWDTAPDIDPAAFAFVPPEGATALDADAFERLNTFLTE